MAKHRCDVAGCNRHRFRWQRICARCFAVLPRRTSLALIAAYHAGDRRAWRALQKESGRLLANNLASQARRKHFYGIEHHPKHFETAVARIRSTVEEGGLGNV